MRLLAIDPGTEQSAFVVYDGTIGEFGILPNQDLLIKIHLGLHLCDTICLEQVVSYGKAVGADVFETVFWTGRFYEAFRGDRFRIPRLNVKQHLCHSGKAKDPNIRQALIDKFGGPAACKKGGILHGISKDVWAALGVAVTFWEEMVETGKY